MTGYTKLALQYRQGMTAFPPPPAGQGGVMVLPATGRRPHELSGLTGYTKLALRYRKSHKQTTATAYHTVGSTKERGGGGEKITCSDCLSPDGEPAAKDLSCLSAEKRGDNSKILTHSLR